MVYWIFKKKKKKKKKKTKKQNKKQNKTKQNKKQKQKQKHHHIMVQSGGGYFHRNAIRGRAAQMGRFLTKNP